MKNNQKVNYYQTLGDISSSLQNFKKTSISVGDLQEKQVSNEAVVDRLLVSVAKLIEKTEFDSERIDELQFSLQRTQAYLIATVVALFVVTMMLVFMIKG